MTEAKDHDVKVWYVPQIPMKAFEVGVPDVATGRFLLDALYEFSAFEFNNRVKPDYADAGGISRWEPDGEGSFGWFDVDEEEEDEHQRT